MSMPALQTRTSDLLALIRAVELQRVDAHGHVYLDYTAAALYPESLLRQHLRLLRRRTLGNPHSNSPAAAAATEDVAAAKLHVLHYFDADPADYDVCFTANASAALKLVGEAFEWSAASRFVLSADNHNSVNGVRELARARGAQITYLPLDDELRLRPFDLPPAVQSSLFAFPAQSNFSGVRHPLSMVEAAQAKGYTVLLDAAAYVPSARLSLRAVPADFVAVSFYKMFGYPSGIGALLARRASVALLRRPWFAGGTVDFVSVAGDDYRLKSDLEAFEDGTVNFLAASAVSLGLAFMERVGIQRIGTHVATLTARLLAGLCALTHGSGAPVVRIYGPRSPHTRGGTIAFNVLDAAGAVIPCSTVASAAAAANISLRNGCFCNPGAAEHALGAVAQDFDPDAGALRASIGYGSSIGDVDALCSFLTRYRTLETSNPGVVL